MIMIMIMIIARIIARVGIISVMSKIIKSGFRIIIIFGINNLFDLCNLNFLPSMDLPLLVIKG